MPTDDKQRIDIVRFWRAARGFEYSRRGLKNAGQKGALEVFSQLLEKYLHERHRFAQHRLWPTRSRT